ncbi:MAG: hypothetical protein LBV16_06060 [Elusimicrobiota bacterium]|jgi:hypothetical protein|nr:hypothetical protein [Elusimicrobiota bacterium]
MEGEKFQQAIYLLKAKGAELDYQGLSYLGYCYFRLKKDDIAEKYINR